MIDIDQYYRNIVLNEIERHGENGSNKMKQFNIKPILNSNEPLDPYAEGLMKRGIWGVQNMDPIFDAVRDGKDYSVLVGFHPSRWHIGHLTLAREIAYHKANGGQPIFVVSGFESGRRLTQDQARIKVEEFWKNVRKYDEQIEDSYEIYTDTEADEIKNIELELEQKINAKTIFGLYGWDSSISIDRLRVPLKIASAFLLPHIVHPKRPSVALLDINQATHTEMAKIAAKKIGVKPSAYAHRVLLQSLKGPNQRMSVKVPNSVVFLDEEPNVVDGKLMKSFTGGRATAQEQKDQGGDISICSYFKVLELTGFSPASCDLNNTIKGCTSGDLSCKNCKMDNTPSFVSFISSVN